MYFCEKRKTVKFYYGSVKMQDGFGYILTAERCGVSELFYVDCKVGCYMVS